MKGYKAFSKGLVCAPDKTKPFQFAENTVFETDEAEICKSGFHFCAEPLDVLDYYPLIDDNGNMTEFAEVEALGEVKTDGNKKYCTNKIKIGAKLSFAQLVRASVSVSIEQTKENAPKEDSAKIGSSGDCAKIGSLGYSAKIGSSGDCAQIGSSGDYAKIGSSGNYAQIGSLGYSAQIGSSGDCAQIGSSGDSAQIKSTGEDSVICCAGKKSIVSAKKGSWITLAEWTYDESKKRNVPICVRTEYVDGKKIKEDTFYRLEANGIKVDGVQETKPPAVAYIDDRAICFDGNAQTLLTKIVNFVPWNHAEEKPETFAEMRARKGYTQTRLAAELGVKQTTISMWETGMSSPTVETCALIALIFHERIGAVAEALFRGAVVMCASDEMHTAVMNEIDTEA